MQLIMSGYMIRSTECLKTLLVAWFMDQHRGQGKKSVKYDNLVTNYVRIFSYYLVKSNSLSYFNQIKIHIYELSLLQNGNLEKNSYDTDFFI